MKNILIVGASGLIGKHLIQLCLSLKWTITTFSYSNKKTAYPINQLPWNPKFIISDENINLELVNAMNEADVVINMAGSTVAKGR